MRVRLLSVLAGTALVVLVAACAAPPRAPVVEREQPPSRKIDYHIVSRGETLYAIAWRYELDTQKLAAANDLGPPYTLRAGQRLTLDTRGISSPQVQRPASSPSRPSSESKPPAREQRQPSRATPALPDRGWSWQWPVSGRVSREYDSNRQFKGINIQSSPGAPVEAAAPGVVVYAGSGLRGYGQLVIVKHSDTYLSAYAHNRHIHVEENQSVRKGQRIGEVGGDPADRNRLYFEIRENGKPVDPTRLLPRQ